MTAPLAGTTAIVTGASRGIGAATARALAAAGARVALLARDRERLAALAAVLPGGAVAVPCDLSTVTSLTSAVESVVATLGVPDIVVSNAGAFALGRVGDAEQADVARMVDVNLLAPYRLAHLLVPAMRRRKRGHFVIIGSIADRVAMPENAGYAASKYGVRAIHEVLRLELAGSGVRTTLISPGPVDTELWDPIAPETRPGYPSRDQMLRPEDVADAVLWVVTRPAQVDVGEVRMGAAVGGERVVGGGARTAD